MKSIRYFITGTDTHIGKTYTSLKLLKFFANMGFSTLGIKPIASGSKRIHKQWVNEDAYLLQQASTISYPYELINPLLFPEFIAPHIAASLNQKTIQLNDIVKQVNAISNENIDVMICEGVGGWDVPLNDKDTTAQMAKFLDFPVILVVGMRLGCLNHAILTFKAIKNSGVPIAGWIANCIDPTMSHLEENITTLKHWLTIPFLAMIPYNGELNCFDFPPSLCTHGKPRE